jgi:hypothetical protein
MPLYAVSIIHSTPRVTINVLRVMAILVSVIVYHKRRPSYALLGDMITTDTKIAIILRILIVTRGVEWIIELANRGINHAMEGENGSIERLEIELIFFDFIQRFDLQKKLNREIARLKIR